MLLDFGVFQPGKATLILQSTTPVPLERIRWQADLVNIDPLVGNILRLVSVASSFCETYPESLIVYPVLVP